MRGSDEVEAGVQPCRQSGPPPAERDERKRGGDARAAHLCCLPVRAEIRSDHGTGPALVYLPGIDGTGNMLFGTEERLARHFRILTVRYRSDDGAAGDRYPELAASAIGAVVQRGVGRALLLAESFGGAVALRAALDHPERVSGLALVNTFPHFRARTKLWLSRRLLPLVPAPLCRLGQRWGNPLTLLGGRREPEAVEHLRAMGTGRLGPAYWRRLEMITHLDLRLELGKVRQPVTVFASDRDRVVDAVPQGRRMVQRLPNAELVVIERAGHVVLPLRELPWEDWLLALAARA